MNKFLIPVILSILILLGISTVYADEHEVTIPSWVKAVAGYWSDDEINDLEFIEALEFLIDNRVINLGNNTVVGMSETSLFELEKEYEEKIEQKEKEWQEKYDEQEKTHREGRFSDSQQWAKLSNEYDQKFADEEKRYDDMVEQKGKEYRQAVQSLENEIEELKK